MEEVLREKNMLFAVFLCCMVVGIMLMCFLSKREEKGDNAPVQSSFGAMLKYIVSPFKDCRILLIIPLMAYCSLVAGRLTSGLYSITLIMSAGAIIQAVVLFWLLLFLQPHWPLFIGALWGAGDGVLYPQLNSVLGLFFQEAKEAAFAQFKVWQSGAIAVIFFLSPYITLQYMLILMTTALFISFGTFLFLIVVI